MSELPAPHASLADQLMGLARLVEDEGEIASRPGQLDRLDAIANRLRALSGLEYERSRSVDWPARFRDAAEAAAKTGAWSIEAAVALHSAASALRDAPSAAVEAIGQALLG